MNSRVKGAVAEREVAHIFQAAGIECERGGFDGPRAHPDLVFHDGGFPYHVEIKRRERIGALYEWMDQSEKDAPAGKVPVVIMRKNGKPWLVVQALNEFLKRI